MLIHRESLPITTFKSHGPCSPKPSPKSTIKMPLNCPLKYYIATHTPSFFTKTVKSCMQQQSKLLEHTLEDVAAGDVHTAWQELVNAPGTRDYEKQDAGVRFLKVVRDAWEDHTLCMKMIRDVLMYLVRSAIHRDGVDN